MSASSPAAAAPAHLADPPVVPPGTDAHAGRRQWLLRKNCSFSPRQVLLFYLSLTTISFGIAGFFAWKGLWMVLPFSLVENLVLAGALVCYGRHAVDRECVSLEGDVLRVDVVRAERVTRHAFNARWARLEWCGKRQEALCVCHGRQAVPVATFLPPEQRRRFARELRAALRDRR